MHIVIVKKRFLISVLPFIPVVVIFIFVKEKWDIFAVWPTVKFKFVLVKHCVKMTGWTVPVTELPVDWIVAIL